MTICTLYSSISVKVYLDFQSNGNLTHFKHQTETSKMISLHLICLFSIYFGQLIYVEEPLNSISWILLPAFHFFCFSPYLSKYKSQQKQQFDRKFPGPYQNNCSRFLSGSNGRRIFLSCFEHLALTNRRKTVSFISVVTLIHV